MQEVSGEPPRRRWRGWFSRAAASLARGAETAILRFPAGSLAIVVFSLVSNLSAAGYDIPDRQGLVWLLGALYGGAAASVAATLAAEARGWPRLSAQILAFVTLAVAAVAIYSGGRSDSHLPALAAALTFAIPLVPYVGRGGPARFWTFSLWAAVGATLGFVSVLLFVLGLSAILEMVRYLFEVGLSSQAYEHIWITAFTLVGPLFAMGRLPRDFEERPETGSDRLVGGVRLLVDWVAVPLALATAAILHLYAAKIAVSGTLPKNEIGWIVTFDALFVLSLRIAAAPFLDGGPPPTRLFARLWPFLLGVPLVLAAIGIGIRINAEGVTIERYYVALAILAAALVLSSQALPRARGDIRVMAAIPVVLLALSAFGPLGAAGVTARSQVARIVAEFGSRVPGSDVIAVRQMDRRSEDRTRLRSRLYALDEAGRLGDLKPYLDPELAERLDAALRSEPDRAVEVVSTGVGAGLTDWADVAARGFTALKPAEIDVGGYDRALLDRRALPRQGGEPVTGDGAGGAAGDPGGVGLSLVKTDLVVRRGGIEDRFPLGAAIDRLPGSIFEAQPQDVAMPVVEATSEAGRHLRLAVRRLTQSEDGSLTYLQFDLFLRAADWQ
ncbi:DUF4153 domain-containing protein [Jiella sonneratiae]|uniref:DUF4153 domain-containing protein n=1 Tax=Jiella sonneratiae TaxID=2816856 RepID=A0ABS3J7G8_9HYPH|nr:DUF4153 domain-containing protein [Jiella sonneratiae]MBO0905631.1 DUF4153 domain-containing protein [Jiella sonneratiae]